MIEIQNENLIQQYILQYQLQDYFLDMPSMQLFQIEKEEVLNVKLNPRDFFIFLVKGRLFLTNIRKGGSSYQISNIQALSCLGDMELFPSSRKQYTITAASRSHLLVIDLREHRDHLMKDYKFLQYILRNVIQKLDFTSSTYTESDTLVERLFHYAKINHGEITEIEKTANHLCCSRRQLQRILAEQCRMGTIVKIQKGKYIVNSKNS